MSEFITTVLVWTGLLAWWCIALAVLRWALDRWMWR